MPYYAVGPSIENASVIIARANDQAAWTHRERARCDQDRDTLVLTYREAGFQEP